MNLSYKWNIKTRINSKKPSPFRENVMIVFYEGGVGCTMAVVWTNVVDVDSAFDVQILTDVAALASPFLCRASVESLTAMQVFPPSPTPTMVDVKYCFLTSLPSIKIDSVSTLLSRSGGSSLRSLGWWDLEEIWHQMNYVKVSLVTNISQLQPKVL